MHKMMYFDHNNKKWSPRMPNAKTQLVVEKRAFNIVETAKIVGLGRTTMYRYIHTGDFDSIKIGRRRLFLMEHIEALLSKYKNGKLP